ncbi:MAG: DUF885 domain-containing protein [Candidatus Nanopelagicaceae bacterium]
MTMQSTTTSTWQENSVIAKVSSEYVTEAAKLSPINSTNLGIAGLDDQLDDYSLAHAERSAKLLRDSIAKITSATALNDFDRIARDVALERMHSYLELHDSREAYVLWGVLWSPVSSIRQVFEMMNPDAPDHLANVTSRMNAVGRSFESWKQTLLEVAKGGKVTARRQVLGVADQLETFAKGAFTEIATRFDPEGKNLELHAAAKSAEGECTKLSIWMRETYAPLSNPSDPVGRDRYLLWARHFTGADLDLEATYQWGREELDRINDRMWKVAAKLYPDAKSLREVADRLEEDPRYVIDGSDELLRRLREFVDAAVKRLDGAEFDIDPRIKFCDCRLAPEGSASAAYYMGPSEDFSRPGTTWFPTMGKEKFSFWHIASTWYHEAVPGHHLQVATSMVETERLNRYQRNEAWTSGHGEGWALYAERLMDELGAFADPGYEMGYLSAQALRAARVVVDIGMHLGFEGPDGKPWSAESAFLVLRDRALLDEVSARSEVDRYLGLPGQAISYKVGERVWMKTREDAKRRLGEKFSLKSFHKFALALGPMGLDPFEKEMAAWQG